MIKAVVHPVRFWSALILSLRLHVCYSAIPIINAALRIYTSWLIKGDGDGLLLCESPNEVLGDELTLSPRQARPTMRGALSAISSQSRQWRCRRAESANVRNSDYSKIPRLHGSPDRNISKTPVYSAVASDARRVIYDIHFVTTWCSTTGY